MSNEEITSFRNQYAFLSNFWYCKVAYDGVVYPTSEHAYVAAKSFDLAHRERVKKVASPSEAKAIGREVALRPDWESVKVGIMYAIVLDKFTRNSDLKEGLLSTGRAYLVEGNTWGDRFWGAERVRGQWVGENWLGKCLMAIRETIGETHARVE